MFGVFNQFHNFAILFHMLDYSLANVISWRQYPGPEMVLPRSISQDEDNMFGWCPEYGFITRTVINMTIKFTYVFINIHFLNVRLQSLIYTYITVSYICQKSCQISTFFQILGDLDQHGCFGVHKTYRL